MCVGGRRGASDIFSPPKSVSRNLFGSVPQNLLCVWDPAETLSSHTYFLEGRHMERTCVFVSHFIIFLPFLSFFICCFLSAGTEEDPLLNQPGCDDKRGRGCSCFRVPEQRRVRLSHSHTHTHTHTHWMLPQKQIQPE